MPRFPPAECFPTKVFLRQISPLKSKPCIRKEDPQGLSLEGEKGLLPLSFQATWTLL